MQDLPKARFLSRTTPPNLFTLMLLAGISALAMNVFLPSLPSMAAHFETSVAVMGLSVGVYLGVSAVLQLLIGPVSDNLGRRNVMLAALVVFCLATLGCIFAPSSAVFLVFRMVQAAAAVCMVLSRAVVRDMVPGEQAGSMIAYVTMGMAVVPMIGPAIGGWLDEQFGWQANFWLLFGAGLLTLAVTWADLGETARASSSTLAQQFREYPELLTSPRFWGYCLASALGSGAFFAYLGGAPFVGSVVYGLEPAELGLYFGAPAIGYFLGNFLSGRFSVRMGINAMVLWGVSLTTLGSVLSLLVTLAGYGSAFTFFGFMTFVGLGNGLSVPNATAGMLSVRPHLAGTASGLGGAIMIGGGAGLSALAGLMLSPGTGSYPLLAIMALSSAGGIVAMILVIRRQRRLGLGL
jgi:DHA1 family bicyclomycin/chloramphenicol resistance-like MFS transporter